MTIRSKLLIIIMLAFVVGSGVIVATVYSMFTINDYLKEERHARDVTARISDLMILTQEYVIQPTARLLQQWQISYDWIIRQLSSISENRSEDSEQVWKLTERLQAFRKQFDRIVELRQGSEQQASGKDRRRRLEHALTGRLLVQAGRIVDNADELNKQISSAIFRQQQRIDRIVISVVLVFVVISIVTAYLILRGLARPIALLKQETRLISDGRFEHPVNAEGTDEISELARSFEDMRKNLLQTMVSKQQLEAFVDQRTAELREAKERAEKASHAKSRFLSSMSHELRTPLNAILGFGQLFEVSDRDLSREEIHEYAQEILQAGHHLLDLINEVLDLARIESGHLDLRMQAVPLAEVIQVCIRQIESALASKRGVELINRVDNANLVVQADPGKLKQVMINLLSNAVKYNKRGGSVTVETEQAGANRIRVLVSDTGMGIAEDGFDKLFEPFERLSYKYSNVEGTGIGLTVTRRLVEAMDGTIGVESIEHQGSTFWIELALADAG